MRYTEWKYSRHSKTLRSSISSIIQHPRFFLEAWNNEASNFSFTVGVDVGPCSFGKARDDLVFGLRFIYELRSKWCSWEVGHVQTGWSPIRCEGVRKFSRSEMIKVSDRVPLWWSAGILSTLGCLLTVRFLCLVLVLLCGLVLSTQARCSQHVLAEWAYACLLFLCAPIQKCETGETINNWRANFLNPKLQIWNWIKFVEVWVLQRAWNHLATSY